jgi:hypothetical protein
MGDDSLPKDYASAVEPLQRGNLLWKIRGPHKWFRRKYRVNVDNMALVYEPSMKMCSSKQQRGREFRLHFHVELRTS